MSFLSEIDWVFLQGQDNPRGLLTHDEYIGFIAHEVRKVCPKAVSEGQDGYLDFNLHPVNTALVNAVKELKAENDTLREGIKQNLRYFEKITRLNFLNIT